MRRKPWTVRSKERCSTCDTASGLSFVNEKCGRILTKSRSTSSQWSPSPATSSSTQVKSQATADTTATSILVTEPGLYDPIYAETVTGGVLERLLGGGEAHKYKVAMAADLVALWHNGRITVDRGRKRYPLPAMPDPSRLLKHKVHIKPAR